MGEYIKAYPYDYDFILGENSGSCRIKPSKTLDTLFFVAIAMLAFCGPCNVLADSGGESSAVYLSCSRCNVV